MNNGLGGGAAGLASAAAAAAGTLLRPDAFRIGTLIGTIHTRYSYSLFLVSSVSIVLYH